MNIRQLSKNDANSYKSIRLEMLQSHPEAFGGSYEESKALPIDFFENYLVNNFVIGTFIDNQLVASLGAYLNRNKKVKHCAVIFGVFVNSNYRGQNITHKMTEYLIKLLPDFVEQIKLTVTLGNKAAYATYKKLDFIDYGHEKRALKIDDQYFDEIHMMKFLK